MGNLARRKIFPGKESFAGKDGSRIGYLSVDPKGQTAVLKGPRGKTAVARFSYAKYEGSYSGVADIKPGEKISGEGQVVNGTNWIQKVAPAATCAAPAVGPKKD